MWPCFQRSVEHGRDRRVDQCSSLRARARAIAAASRKSAMSLTRERSNVESCARPEELDELAHHLPVTRCRLKSERLLFLRDEVREPFARP